MRVGEEGEDGMGREGERREREGKEGEDDGTRQEGTGGRVCGWMQLCSAAQTFMPVQLLCIRLQ